MQSHFTQLLSQAKLSASSEVDQLLMISHALSIYTTHTGSCRQEATVTMFAGHIVIGIFADDDSPLLGLRNLVMPLRF